MAGKYQRIILKISGEGLAGAEGFGIGSEPLQRVATEIKSVHDAGVEVAIVVGGGNILRGGAFAANSHICEATAHHMGMLATVMNALALAETLEHAGIDARVMSSVAIPSIVEMFDRRQCIRYLEQGCVVVLAGGTGRPFVTTDTATALAGAELGADAIFKATQVDGIYSADPKKDKSAKFYPTLTFDEAIDQRLKVMDISAMDLCHRANLQLVVFNLHKSGNMRRIIDGESVGTIVSNG